MCLLQCRTFDCLIWPAQMSLQKDSAPIKMSMLVGMLKLGSASFIYFGIDTLCMGMKCCGKCYVIFRSTMQSIFSQKLLKRNLTQRLTTLLAWITPPMTPATAISRGRSSSFNQLANSLVTKFIYRIHCQVMLDMSEFDYWNHIHWWSQMIVKYLKSDDLMYIVWRWGVEDL